MKSVFTCLSFTLLFFHQAVAQLQAVGDTAICAGQPVQLSVSGGTTYTWTPAGSLNDATSATPIATPTQTTTYIVSSPLPNTNLVPNPDFSQGNTGFTSSYTYEVPTNILGSGAYFVGGNANHWNPGMSQFCTDRTGGADTMMLIANGALTSPTPVWCVTLPVSPNCTYTLTGYFQCFSQTNLPAMRWMVNGTPTGNASAPAFLQCVWNSFSTTWNSGNNTTATFCIYDTNISGNGNDFALDDISIVGSGTAYDTVTVTVLPAPNANLGSDTTLCRNSMIRLAGPFGLSYSYLWSDSSTFSELQVSTAGTYGLTVTSNNGCSASDVIVVDTSTLQNPVIATTDSLICASDSAQLCVVSASAPYVWNANSSTSTCIYTSLAGNYWIVVTDNHGCTASSNRIPISVLPVPPVSISVNGDTLIGYNSTAYQWYRDGSPILGATGSTYIATQSGSYTLEVTDANGCKAMSTAVNVVTGIDEVVGEAVRVYPNPSSGIWNLSVGEELIGARAEITDAEGRLVHQSLIMNELAQIQIGNETAAGIYWLKIVSSKLNQSIRLVKF